MHRRAMLRASPRRRGVLMASLLAFSPPHPTSHLQTFARHRGVRLLVARAAAGGDPETPPPAAERRSLAVAAGELFIGLAARLVRRGVGREEVVAVEERDGVLWEQRAKDVEAERRRREVTSPGFSFSAAGLLFPYHLGVAHCLLDKGYIT